MAKTMAVKVKIDRESAIRAGSANYGEVVVHIDPAELSQEHRDVLAEQQEDPASGITSTGLSHNHFGRLVEIPWQDAFTNGADNPVGIEAVRAALDAVLAKQEKEKEKEKERRAEAEAQAEAFMAFWQAQPIDAMAKKPQLFGGDSFSFPSDAKRRDGAPPLFILDEPGRDKDLVGRMKSELAPWIERAEEITAQHAATYEERQRQLKDEADRKAQKAREDQLSFVKEHMPEHLERYEAGLMPETELEKAVKAQVFAGFDYDNFVVSFDDLSGHADHCDETELSVLYDDIGRRGLSTGEFDALTEVRKAAPDGATVTPFMMRSECDTCRARNVAPVASIEVVALGFTLIRNVLIGADKYLGDE